MRNKLENKRHTENRMRFESEEGVGSKIVWQIRGSYRYLTYNRFKQCIVFKQYDLSKASNLGIVVIFEAIYFDKHQYPLMNIFSQQNLKLGIP